MDKKKIICCAVTALYAVIFTFVLLIQLTYSSEKLLSFIVFMPISVAAAFFVLHLAEKKSLMLKKHGSKLLAAGLLVMFAIMLFFGFSNMQEYTDSSGKAYWDLGNVMQSAESLAMTGEIETEYFARYTNNLFIVILFGGIASLVRFFTGSVEAFYPVMVVLNCLILTAGVFFIVLSAKKLRGITGGAIAYVACFFFAPLYLISATPYSDTIAFLCMSVMVYMVVSFLRRRKIRYIVLFGAVAAFGAAMKITVAIMGIAFLVVLIFTGRELRRRLKACGVLVMTFVMCYASINIAVNSSGLISGEDRNTYQFPVTHWFMMSLQGDGTYSQEDVEFTASAGDYEAKKEATITEIKKRIDSMGAGGTLYHVFITKNRATWCSGTLGTLWMLQFSSSDTPLNELIIHHETVYKGIAAYAYGFFAALTTLALAGVAVGFKRHNSAVSVMRLTLIGAFLFFLIWEAKTTYIFQFMPVIFVLAIDSLSLIKKVCHKRRNQTAMKKAITIRSAAIILAAIYLISLIPVLALGFYSSPVADDLSYGRVTAAVVSGGGSPADVISVAAEQAGNVYNEWQGSFAAVFLMALQPGIFGEGYYFLTTVIMLLSLTAGTLLFLRELLMKCFGADIWQYLLISSVILIMTVHFCYFPAETFYWFNGGIYYAFFYSLALALGAAVLFALRTKNTALKIVMTALSALMCGFIGGGNYTTAICVMILLALLSAGLAVKKDRRAVITLIVLAVGMTVFLFSVFAPGNGVRQASEGTGTDPVTAIALSFVLGGYIIFNSLSLPVFICFACITPVLYLLAKRSPLEFRHPVWFTIISFGVFSAQCTPPIYGLGISVPERLLNIIYFSFYIWALLNIFVWCGFISRKYQSASEEKFFAVVRNNSTAVFAAAAVLFAALAVGICRIGRGDDGAVKISGLPLGAEAVYELVSGNAGAYRDVNTQRVAILSSEDISDAVLPEYTKKPYLLFVNDYTQDPLDWRNRAAAGYYGKNSVVLE